MSPQEAAAGKLVEGAATAHALVTLARARNVDMPVAEAVDRMLSGTLDHRRRRRFPDEPSRQIRAVRTAMAHWLYKSEPSTWSWDDQVKAGAKGTFWSGVRNHSAKLNMMAMKKGDRGFFYHSNEGKAVVGIVEVIKEYYPDHTDPTGKFGMVDIKAVKALKRPVTLDEIKAEPDAQGHDPRQQFAPVGAAGDRRRMGDHLPDGRIVGADIYIGSSNGTAFCAGRKLSEPELVSAHRCRSVA